MKFLTDERVTITDTADRWYGSVGTVTDYYVGQSSRVYWLVTIDGRDDPLPFTDDQITTGENIYVS